MRQDANTFDNLRGAILHQPIVGGDVRFTFGGVNDQGLNVIATATQLHAGRETRAAQTGHAKLMNSLNQRFACV